MIKKCYSDLNGFKFTLFSIIVILLLNQRLVSASPTKRKSDILEDLLNDDVLPLDHEFNYYTLKCKGEGHAIIKESEFKKSPYLYGVLAVDSTASVLTIPINECNQEILDMAIAFMRGDFNVWTEITAFNAEKLLILADYFELQDLLDQCIVWIVKRMFNSKFELSESWKNNYALHAQEIYTLLQSIRDDDEIIVGEVPKLKIVVKGEDFFSTLGKIKRFSRLEVEVHGTIPLPLTPIHSTTGLRAISLDFSHHEQTEFPFLANGNSFPMLKKLSFYRADLSDLTLLSKALNEQKMPQLEVLDISWNAHIQLNTFQLETSLSNLKELRLEWCRLTNISSLTDLLNQMPKLEKLVLSGNPNIELDSLKLVNTIPLKMLNIGFGSLTRLSGLAEILYKTPQLEQLVLSQNTDMDLTTFKLDKPISLKKLNLEWCGLSNVSPLTNILSYMPQLEELYLLGNMLFELDTFQLEIPLLKLKILNLEYCDIAILSPLTNLLYMMPHLEELSLVGNEHIRLHTLTLNSDAQLIRLNLGNCGLTNLSSLTHCLKHMPELKELNLGGNQDIELNTLNLDIAQSLTDLNLQDCSLTKLYHLGEVLQKIPTLQHLNLGSNRHIDLESLNLNQDLSLKSLSLHDCSLSDISSLSNILNKMPQLEKLVLVENEEIQWKPYQLNELARLKRIKL